MHVLEANSPFREFIEVGSLALGMSEAAQGGVEIIGQEQQNIGFALFSICQGKKRKAQEKENSLHPAMIRKSIELPTPRSWMNRGKAAARLFFHRSLACMRPGGEAGLEKIATRWRFPIDHLASDVDSGKSSQHEILIEFFPGNSSG